MSTVIHNDADRARLLALLSQADISSGGESAESTNKIRQAILADASAPGVALKGAGDLPDGVHVLLHDFWQNFQGNLAPIPVFRQFSMTPLPSGEDRAHEFKVGVERVCEIVKYCEKNGGMLRAVGSSWSSSTICQSKTNILECDTLAGLAPTIPSEHLATGVAQDRICHLHGGTIIDAANKILEHRGQSLQVMGGNAGQNIAGIAATGTHGSWIDRRAVADSILAIALVSAGGRRYWIEPASRPLTNDKFGAWERFFEVIRDDDVFAAAQVSHGALGIVTSVVLSVDPLHKVHFYRSRRAWDHTVQQAVFSHDLNLTHLFPHRRPDHFEIVLNPYQLDGSEQGVYMEAAYVMRPGNETPPPSPHGDRGHTGNPYKRAQEKHMSGGIWDAAAKLLSHDPSLTPHTLNALLPIVFSPEDKVGYLSDVWPLSTGGPPLISAELAVAQQDAERAISSLRTHITQAKNQGQYWPGVFGIRFGKKTGALLGFTKFERWCTLELIYLRGVHYAEHFIHNYCSDLDHKGVHYTVHPGQVNFVTAAKVRQMYGEEALRKWHSVRERLGVSNQLFANDMTNKWGLT